MKTNQLSQTKTNHGLIGKVYLGLLLVGLGIFLLCINNGCIDAAWKSVVISWPMLIAVLGIGAFLHRGFISGGVLLFISLIWLLPDTMTVLGVDAESTKNSSRILLYSAIIIVGLIILLRSLFYRQDKDYHCHCQHDKYSEYAKYDLSQDNQGKINYEFMFSGAEEVFIDPVFKGGQIKTLFGGVSLDLRKAMLEEGETHLVVETLFGGVTLTVPENWAVEIRRECFCGGFDDKRRTRNFSSEAPRLIVHAKCVFGGGEING